MSSETDRGPEPQDASRVKAEPADRVVKWQVKPKMGFARWTSAPNFGLGATGVAAAFMSAAFAFIMVRADINAPSVGGAEYLLLFTRPLQPVGAPDREMAARRPDPGIDYTATGSIDPAARPKAADFAGNPSGQSISRHPAPPSQLPLKDYNLASVRGGIAIIKGPKGRFAVESGSVMPNGDLVLSIDRHAGQWVVVTSGGIIEE